MCIPIAQAWYLPPPFLKCLRPLLHQAMSSTTLVILKVQTISFNNPCHPEGPLSLFLPPLVKTPGLASNVAVALAYLSAVSQFLQTAKSADEFLPTRSVRGIALTCRLCENCISSSPTCLELSCTLHKAVGGRCQVPMSRDRGVGNKPSRKMDSEC